MEASEPTCPPDPPHNEWGVRRLGPAPTSVAGWVWTRFHIAAHGRLRGSAYSNTHSTYSTLSNACIIIM